MFSTNKGISKKSGTKDFLTALPTGRQASRQVAIGLASDHGGFELKEKLRNILQADNYHVLDFGAYSNKSCDYPKFGIKLIKAILSKKVSRGILLCRSGIGFSILANRFKGIRAALCYNVQAARVCRRHNNSNVLILGADYIKEKDAEKILDVWLNTEFEGGRHLRRLKQIERFSR